MRAVVVQEFGGPEVLTSVDAPEPTAMAGQVIVRTSVSGLNFIDVYQRTGLYALPLPFRAGVEGVGVVVAVGPGVTDIAVGQRVGWMTDGQGSFSDLVAVVADKAVLIPDDINDVLAVALLMQGVTAHYLATDAYRVQPGDVALVHAAAGGVGLLLTQIIKLRGGTVIATASSATKLDAARAAGADHAIAYEGFSEAARSLTDGRGVDVVYDSVGAATWEGSLNALRTRGTCVFFGNASGPVPPFEVSRLATLGSLHVTRPTVAHYIQTPAELRGRADELFAWVRAGVLRVADPTRFPREHIGDAFRALESRQTTGKLVLLH